MELEELLEYLSEGKTLTAGTEAYDCMHRWSLETQRLTQELNTGVHDMEEIREYMCRITGRNIDESFRMFLPFYTDFGKTSASAEVSSSTPAAVFRIRAASVSATARLSATAWSLLP